MNNIQGLDIKLEDCVNLLEHSMTEGYYGQITIHIQNGRIIFYEERRTYKTITVK